MGCRFFKGNARITWLCHASCGKPNDDFETEGSGSVNGGAL
jgi:hypothetical protein